MKATTQDIERHFDAAKEITKILVDRTERSQRRILGYFLDLCNEKGDMQEELEILKKVASELAIPYI